MRLRSATNDSERSTAHRLQIIPVEPETGVLRAAVYARTSSPKQTTIPAQVRIARARAQERGWRVKYVLQDEALRGDDLTRPGFQRLIDLAERRAIDVVVVWKIDRLARSLSHAVAVEELFQQYMVAIHSCTEPIDTTTPVGRFIFGNLANAAQLEKDIIRERTRMGVFQRASDGKWIQPNIPLGYKKVKGRRLAIDAADAEIVREVFRAYKDHRSFAETAHALNAAGLTFEGSRGHGFGFG
jgi:site-specific DNA recombinase